MSNLLTDDGTAGKRNLQEIPLAQGGVKGRYKPEDTQQRQTEDSEGLKEEREKRQERFLKELDKESGDTERKLKTTSLKRFFGLAPKKLSEPALELSGKRETDIEKQNSTEDDDDDDDGDGDNAEAAGGMETYKRFKLRLGGMHRYSRDSESKIDLNSVASKVTLKSSLSSYWNTVFKKKKSKSVNDMEHTSDAVRTTNYLETNDQGHTLTEDIHALKISEDAN